MNTMYPSGKYGILLITKYEYDKEKRLQQKNGQKDKQEIHRRNKGNIEKVPSFTKECKLKQ